MKRFMDIGSIMGIMLLGIVIMWLWNIKPFKVSVVRPTFIIPTTTPIPQPTKATGAPSATPPRTSVTIHSINPNAITGIITEVEGIVAYKDSILIEIDDNINTYVTSSTKVIGEHGNAMQRIHLKVGDEIILEGIPAEGGIEAKKITIIRTLTLTPTPTTTSAPLPPQ